MMPSNYPRGCACDGCECCRPGSDDSPQCCRQQATRVYVPPQRGAPSIDFDGTGVCLLCATSLVADGMTTTAPTDDDTDAECPGHESTEGPMGISTHCDGTCQAISHHATRAEKWSAR